MFYVKNLPVWERVLRIVAAVAVMLFAWNNFSAPWAVGAMVAAGGMSLSGLFGFCPACALVGRRLKK